MLIARHMGTGDKVRMEGEKSENTLVIWEKDVRSLKKFFSSSKKREQRKRRLDAKQILTKIHTQKSLLMKAYFFHKKKSLQL